MTNQLSFISSVLFIPQSLYRSIVIHCPSSLLSNHPPHMVSLGLPRRVVRLVFSLRRPSFFIALPSLFIILSSSTLSSLWPLFRSLRSLGRFAMFSLLVSPSIFSFHQTTTLHCISACLCFVVKRRFHGKESSPLEAIRELG